MKYMILSDIHGSYDDLKKAINIFEEENVSSLAQNIGYAYVLDFKDYHLNYENGIDKVTKADIVAAAKKMTSGPMYFGITSNE